MRNQRRGQHGATIVESAIVFSLISLLILGIIEGALYFRAYLASERAAQAGARQGSITGAQSGSDYFIIHSAINETAGAANGDLDLIMVYKAGGPDGNPDPQCLFQVTQPNPVGIDGKCNIYTKADFSVPASSFGTVAYGKDLHWNETSRVQSQAAGTDFLGVYVGAHSAMPVASLFGLAPTMHKADIERLEATTR